ncbi:MAG TPA: hypothetical protein ENJ77_00510 [Candidatus Moranbacteria bacterium]|nr:hypothetical protein [Candidatus Moranbacteria bacterium]
MKKSRRIFIEKCLAVFIFAGIFLSFLYLSLDEKKRLADADWWAIYFNRPSERENYDFTIDNRSREREFVYTLPDGQTGTVRLRPGETFSVSTGKFTSPSAISVRTGQETKTIAK